MSIVKAKAYIPSVGEYDTLKEKYPAFASADVSEKAKKQGAGVSSDYKDKGFYPLRFASALSRSSTRVAYGNSSGFRDWLYTGNTYAGLRVALPLIYNPHYSIVRCCRQEARTTKIWDIDKSANIVVASKAPVVNYGGIEYIWSNKEECESGKSKVMNLVSLKLVEKALPFDRQGNHNDYAKAEELRAQCERVAFENATEEEKEMAVEVTMSSEDNYEKLTYSYLLLENEEESEME